jgi:hypothetical protein
MPDERWFAWATLDAHDFQAAIVAACGTVPATERGSTDLVVVSDLVV